MGALDSVIAEFEKVEIEISVRTNYGSEILAYVDVPDWALQTAFLLEVEEVELLFCEVVNNELSGLRRNRLFIFDFIILYQLQRAADVGSATEKLWEPH